MVLDLASDAASRAPIASRIFAKQLTLSLALSAAKAAPFSARSSLKFSSLSKRSLAPLILSLRDWGVSCFFCELKRAASLTCKSSWILSL